MCRLFCNLKTCTPLLAYMYIKYSGNVQIKTERRQDQLSTSSCLRLLLLTALQLPDDLKMFFWGLETLVFSPIITRNFQCDMWVIQPATSPWCFGCAKMAANSGLGSQLQMAEKAEFKSLHVWHLTGKILSFEFHPKAVYFECASLGFHGPPLFMFKTDQLVFRGLDQG